MTPEQALAVLIAAAKLAPMNFQDHVVVGEASKIVYAAIQPPTPAPVE